MVELIAHRGYSARQPEMTRAAYAEAIAWSARTRVPLSLECDVQFCADDVLVCLHDLTLDRTSTASGPAYARTLAELRAVDFGSRHVRRPTPDQRAVVTVAELLDLVATARADGVEVSLTVETKHPNPRGLEVEARLAAMLRACGWDAPGSPVRLISFSPSALARLAELLPHLPRTLLLEHTLGRFADGTLPPAVDAVGPDVRLLRADPGFVARAHRQGHVVQPWTVNSPVDIDLCLDLGVASLTTDDPARAAAVIGLVAA